jgi:hypothetical protein
MTFRAWAVDTAERVISTFIQSAIVFVLAADGLDASRWQAFVAATIPAVLGVVKGALTTWMPQSQNFRIDALIRTLWTFALSVLGLIAADGFDLLDADAWTIALTAGATSALAVVKAFVARPRPDTITPASLAPASLAG